MCYARRQRSSWARIKLSKKWLYIRSLAEAPTYVSRVAYSSFSYFFEFLNVFLNEIPSHFSVLWISVVQFSKTKLRHDSFVATFISYHANGRLSSPFLKLFSSFFRADTGHPLVKTALFPSAPSVYHAFLRLSRGKRTFFGHFSKRPTHFRFSTFIIGVFGTKNIENW